jgi:hypothetical protein
VQVASLGVDLANKKCAWEDFWAAAPPRPASAAYAGHATRVLLHELPRSIHDRHERCQMARNEGLLQSRCKLALACIVCRSTASNVMKTLASWAPAPNLTVTAIESGDPDWIVFAERLSTLATPFAPRTARLAGNVRLFGHSVGGRASERLMARLGMPVSDTTILRSVKECIGVLMGWTPPSSGVQHLHFGTSMPSGGLPTVYQGLFSVAREGLKVVPVFNMAQATLRRRSAIDRRARPWL